MRTSQTLIATLREAPADAVIASHRLMLRAGLMRKLGNGLFAYLPLGLRAFRKVEQIVREEMDAIGALEFKPPVVVPGELWRESGRWDTFGSGMLKAKNRVDQELVVSPTAEEAFTALIRDELSSYKQLPVIAYQINTKYRDEIRPRYGVMRAREFVMHDAYSFHADQASLDEVYGRFAGAYRRIFKRCGLDVISVGADSGAMGGSGSEEFMIESEIGDNTLILCPKCGYAANDEKASCAPDAPLGADGKPQARTDKVVKEIATPNARTIEELTAFLSSTPQAFIKTLIYRVQNSELENFKAPVDFAAVCIRGDLEVNEVKLASALKASEVELASDGDVERITGAPVGFAGPVGLTRARIVVDKSVLDMHDAVTGALKKDAHFVHVEPGRDFPPALVVDARAVKAGDKCPVCGAAFYSKKGNELGHIFKLGRKYSKAMKAAFLDEKGVQQTPLMGCYGIGVDRALASVIEEHHDERGIVWPMSAAPYHAVIVPIQYEGEMKAAADALYEELRRAGVEALLDDRSERPGVKFNDMDLLGIPIRVVIGSKNLPNAEIKMRGEEKAELVPLAKTAAVVSERVKAELAALNA